MVTPDPDVATDTDTDPAPGRDRRCGRCQRIVPGDSDLHPIAQLGWWLCPSCREALVGHQRQARS